MQKPLAPDMRVDVYAVTFFVSISSDLKGQNAETSSIRHETRCLRNVFRTHFEAT